MMRVLTILSLVAAALWGGWWFVGSSAVDRGAREGIAALQAEGWTVDIAEVSVTGFPSRFDTRLAQLDLVTPDGLWGVRSPFLQVFALSYRPNEVIAVAAPDMVLRTPIGPVELTAEDLRASVKASVSTTPDLTQAVVVGQKVTADAGALTLDLARGQVAVRAADDPDSYDLAVSLASVLFGGAGLDARLPSRFDLVEVDALAFLDRPAAEGGTLVAATLRRAEVAWDDTTLNLTGEVEVSRSGLLDGTLTLSLTGWRDLLALATELGLPPARAALLAGGMSGLDVDGTATVPLTLRGGQLLFGTIPLAQLPRLPPSYNP